MNELLESEGPIAFALFHRMVSDAVWQPEGSLFVNYGVRLARGQLIMGRRRYAEVISAGLPLADRRQTERFESLVRRALDRWVKKGWIKREPLPVHAATTQATGRPTNPPTLVTILIYYLFAPAQQTATDPATEYTPEVRQGRSPNRRTRRRIKEQPSSGLGAPEPNRRDLMRISRLNSDWGRDRLSLLHGCDQETIERDYQQYVGFPSAVVQIFLKGLIGADNPTGESN
jgi:hypothetical protein